MVRKYVVDVVEGLPVILMELNGSTVEKAYIYANGQIIAQHDGAPATTNKYFYLHDRLGSVRQIINYESSQVNVVDRYTYTPFGETYPSETQQDATLKNRFMFTGQYYDDEIGQYYLRARQYDPYLARFTTRDPVTGKFREPLTLHRYLYCLNDPIDNIDPSGEETLGELWAATTTRVKMAASSSMAFLGKVWELAQRIYYWAGVKMYELSAMLNGVNLSGRSAQQARFDPESLQPNKLNHIFNKPGRNFTPLLRMFCGSQKDAGTAVGRALERAVNTGSYSEEQLLEGIVVNVNGVILTVTGVVQNGMVKIGSFWATNPS